MIVIPFRLVRKRTLAMDEKTIDVLIEENDMLRKQIIEAEGLLRASLPYAYYHFERSRAGYGQESKKLIDSIKKFIGDE